MLHQLFINETVYRMYDIYVNVLHDICKRAL